MADPERIEADHEAIADLRKEFDRFFYEQRDAMERAAWLIGAAIEDVERKEYKWRRDKQDYERRLEECEEQALYAAMHLGYVDCSDWVEAVGECDRVLGILDRAHDRLDVAVNRYQEEKSAVEQWLGFELPRVRKYLDDRIDALRAFLAETV